MPATLRGFTVAALALAAALIAGAAPADDYPSHPIRLIVPYAAGGGARLGGTHHRQTRR